MKYCVRTTQCPGSENISTTMASAAALAIVTVITIGGCGGSEDPQGAESTFPAANSAIDSAIDSSMPDQFVVSKPAKAKPVDPVDGPGVVAAIQKMAAENCNVDVFTQANVHPFVLGYEWAQIQKQASQVYRRTFGVEESVPGNFLTTMPDYQTGDFDRAFYSTDKRFQVLIANALMGDKQTHFKVSPGTGSFFVFLEQLNKKYTDVGVDYQMLADDIEEPFKKATGTKDPIVQVDSDLKNCKISSEWKQLQTIDDIEYQYRMTHRVFESSNSVYLPGQIWTGVSTCVQFHSSVEVRRSGNQEITHGFGPLKCTLLGRTEKSKADHKVVSWYASVIDETDLSDLTSENAEEKLPAVDRNEFYGQVVTCMSHAKKIYDTAGELDRVIKDAIQGSQ